MSNEAETLTPEVLPESAAEKIAATIEEGLPICIRRESQDVIDAVMSPARSVIRDARPTTVAQAQQWLGSLTEMLLHIHQTYGDVDVSAALTHDVIEDYINRVNAARESGWRKTHRSRLRHLGLVVNPQAWPQSERLAAHVAADIYTEEDETAFGLAGELALFKGKLDQAFVVVGCLGAGLSGPEMARVSPEDVVALSDGRLGIWVAHRNSRLVPVREAYTELLSEICHTVRGDHFIHQRYQNAVHNIGNRITVRELGHLSFSRGRSTWIMAHLVIGTPLTALRLFAGPLSVRTLDSLLGAAAERLTPEDAAQKGLLA